MMLPATTFDPLARPSPYSDPRRARLPGSAVDVQRARTRSWFPRCWQSALNLGSRLPHAEFAVSQHLFRLKAKCLSNRLAADSKKLGAVAPECFCLIQRPIGRVCEADRRRLFGTVGCGETYTNGDDAGGRGGMLQAEIGDGSVQSSWPPRPRRSFRSPGEER